MFNKTHYNIFKAFLASLCLIFVIGCNSKENDTVVDQNPCLSSNEYLIYYFEEINKEYTYTFDYLDCGGNLEKSKTYVLFGDIAGSTFDYENDILYLYGSAGLYAINLQDKELIPLAEGLVSSFAVQDKKIAYVDNHGFVDSSFSQYKTELYLLDERNVHTSIATLTYPVGDIKIHNNKIYVTNLPMDPAELTFVEEYSFTGELLNTYSSSEYGVLEKANEKIYLKSNYSFYDFISNVDIPFGKEILSPYDYINVEGDFASLEYDVYNQVCYYDSNEDITYEDCYGYRKISEDKFLIALKDSLYILNENDGAIELSLVVNEDLWKYYFVAY